jgi:hypothetical protein
VRRRTVHHVLHQVHLEDPRQRTGRLEWRCSNSWEPLGQASIDHHQVSRIPNAKSLAPSLLPWVPSDQLARRRRPPRRWDLEPASSKTLDLVLVFAQTHKHTHTRTYSERAPERERGGGEKGYQIESWQKRSGRIHERVSE